MWLFFSNSKIIGVFQVHIPFTLLFSALCISITWTYILHIFNEFSIQQMLPSGFRDPWAWAHTFEARAVPLVWETGE